LSRQSDPTDILPTITNSCDQLALNYHYEPIPPDTKYYCVIDFEATCKRDERIYPQEIIEFPAILIDAQSLQFVEDSVLGRGIFHSYVKPIHHAILTDYCIHLTGIEQQVVDSAPTFPDVFERFLEFLSYYSDSGDHSFPGIVFVTHGDWDLKVALPNQCALSDVPLPRSLMRYVNLKHTYLSLPRSARTHREKNFGMQAMLQYLDMQFIGRPHSGIADSNNIARMLIEILQRGGTCKWTSLGDEGASPQLLMGGREEEEEREEKEREDEKREI
jgi:inhibitor of KinA sporulation pathway (predicted exonuclease)